MPLTPEQKAEIEALRKIQYTTRRATVPAIEEILYQPFDVLDNGFIRVIDYMGDDAAIVQAARVSYGRGTKQTRDDQGLINYLMRNAHTSPFEMCAIKLHVKLPIFVARQWIRHRMANVNEYSARYSVLDNEFYTPPIEQLSAQSSVNKQGRESSLGTNRAEQILDLLKSDASQSFDHYFQMLNRNQEGKEIIPGETGLARELARIGLPLSTYTQWYWKIDLHNLLHFVNLRADSHAQWEIQEYARIMLNILQLWVPLVTKAFINYRTGGAHLSEEGLSVVRMLLAGEQIDPENLKMSPREWRELKNLLALE
ncbi:MAG: thymidylate synthase (FAD) [Chloroflexi bacterium]|jgi:thymidylate synthase (FAD)|nr:thymidylate synthase (FAD) [Chloroflexota bacterium]MCH2532303.1 FAD-dependent thymidylate synthase [Dehalococcoidia bacterium]|tara:strand:+ start:11447 stop:12382 length:936 start_codon:yes stop_codon:yes gene_type:complete